MELYKFSYRKKDGRRWIQYSTTPFPKDIKVSDDGLLRGDGWQPPHLRHNPMRNEWVAISASRQNRPFLPPKEYCPLCPNHLALTDTSGQLLRTEVPDLGREYEWAVFENMYPGLSQLSHPPTGLCEVILYTPNHSVHLVDLTNEKIAGLVRVWQDRSREISSIPGIESVFIFENRGAEIGVTLHHAHGQLYAFHHVPPFIQREHQAAAEYYQSQGRCLVCDLNSDELESGERVIFELEHCLAYVPKAARYPYEVHISTKAHRRYVHELTDSECDELALLLKRIVYKYDQLFAQPMPYIMVHHQNATTQNDPKAYHWHIEFYPALRSAAKLKYLAGVESGTGLFINDTVPEEKAEELRAIVCPF